MDIPADHLQSISISNHTGTLRERDARRLKTLNSFSK